MEEVTETRDIKRRISARRTIWTLFHSWTRGPGVVHTAFHLHRIEMKEYKDPEAVTKAEKETLFYKLFGMSKRQWDAHIKRHSQSQLNKKQRDYFLTVRPEKEKK